MPFLKRHVLPIIFGNWNKLNITFSIIRIHSFVSPFRLLALLAATFPEGQASLKRLFCILPNFI